MHHRRPCRTALALGLAHSLLATALCAQPAPDLQAGEAALAKKASQTLLRYASVARSAKFGPKEKEAYELIIERYDTDSSAARRALDYRKEKEGWKLLPPKRRRAWNDEANREGRFKVQQEWLKARHALAKEHRTLGLQMLAAGGDQEARGKAHLERAIQYSPLDKEAHVALGHGPCQVGETTYYGTEAQVAFIDRMKQIETFALQLAKRTYDPQPVKEIPDVLAKTGLTFAGAQTKNFKVFVRGTQANADDVVQWGERALEFLDFIVGDANQRIRNRARRAMSGWDWIGIFWTRPEMDRFLAVNPGVGGKDREKYINVNFRSGKKAAQVVAINMPSYMHDYLIAHVIHYGLGEECNAGLLEGVHHAATWFLKSTCFAKFGADPVGTESSDKRILPEGANWWLREMRNQAIAGTDTPLDVVPRTQLSHFPPNVRLKTWSFGVWSMARFRETWVDFLRGHKTDRIPFPEHVAESCQKAFSLPITTVEAEWREWASGRDVTAAATGYGPPLLPELPNKDEIEGLERLNAVRAAVTCWPELEHAAPAKAGGTSSPLANVRANTWNRCLPPCEIDSEATAACKDHAKFFGMHEEHWKWPEAHEEDPAKEGFTPRGMRAGLRSVIVWSTGSLDPTSAIDQWIGTVYHRFPLLEYNIKRFGIAFDDAGKCEVIVLDMGSLQEPRDDDLERACALIAWPPAGMKNVPLQFSYTEHPNPLADVGLSFEDQQNTGYPVSLQFSRLIANQATSVKMKLYLGKSRGGTVEAGEEVPCWLHTPDEPLLKRLVLRDVVFVIPKALLKPRTLYKAVVEVTSSVGTRKYEWSFTTGTKKQGLGKLR